MERRYHLDLELGALFLGAGEAATLEKCLRRGRAGKSEQAASGSWLGVNARRSSGRQGELTPDRVSG